MRLLDLYCGAGMAADGWHLAGFTVVGVDINPQPRYERAFVQTDALDLLFRHRHWVNGFAAVGASPPCQAHTRAGLLRKAQGGKPKYGDLLTPTVALLRQTSVPWIVENVEGAPFNPQPGEFLTKLCGSSFGLGVQRHRLFLTNFPVEGLPCRHREAKAKAAERGEWWPMGVYHVPGDHVPKGGRTARDAKHGQEVMGVTRDIPWNSLKEGFPPAYTEHIGRQLIAHLEARAA